MKPFHNENSRTIRRSPKIKPDPNTIHTENIPLSSYSNAYKLTDEPFDFKSTPLSLEKTRKDTSRRALNELSFTSDTKKSISQNKSWMSKIRLSDNETSMSKLRIATIVAGVTIGLIAIAALAVGIYSAVRTSNATTNNITSVTTTLVLRWYSQGTTVAGTGYTGGATGSRLYSPCKIRLISSNVLYIADQSDHRIQKWIAGDATGTTVAGQPNGIAGSNSTDLNQPSSFYVDSSNNIYVVDTNNHRIQLWLNGSFLGTTVAGTGFIGNASNQLNYPRDITMDSSSSILYIADTENHRIMSYKLNVTNGTIVAGGNGAGTLANQLYTPYSVYFDSSSNSLVIANYNSHIIVRWTIGANAWTLLAGSIGLAGSTTTMLYNPTDVILDSIGNIYVADYNNHRIQFFLSGQQNGTTIAGVMNTPGNIPTLLYYPRSILLDSQWNLYVSDLYNQRIQMFLRY